jgi:hypothetical protein
MRQRLSFTDTVILILLALALLAQLNHVLGRNVRDVEPMFPLSVFAGPSIEWAGLSYAAAFLAVLLLAVRLRPTAVRAWISGLSLIALGSLAQGGIVMHFVTPRQFRLGSPYIREACKITDWHAWLSQFNAAQARLLASAGTHPPFATLLTAAFRRPEVTAFVFMLVASLSIPLLYRVLKAAGTSAERAAELALLFAVIPAVNVYGGVTIDGVILTTSTVFLLGLTRLVYGEGEWLPACALLSVGLILTNALTFGGLILAGIAAVCAVFRPKVRGALGVAAGLGVVAYLVLRVGFGYDHIAAFLQSAATENPHGFRLLEYPMSYFLTRLENVGNIAFFLSVPLLAVVVRRRPDPIALRAILVLALAFALGAYRTGETARACLFIYPFLFLSLRDPAGPRVRWLTAAAAVQTVAMQLLGKYGS